MVVLEMVVKNRIFRYLQVVGEGRSDIVLE